jgi:hypothetical protein
MKPSMLNGIESTSVTSFPTAATTDELSALQLLIDAGVGRVGGGVGLGVGGGVG